MTFRLLASVLIATLSCGCTEDKEASARVASSTGTSGARTGKTTSKATSRASRASLPKKTWRDFDDRSRLQQSKTFADVSLRYPKGFELSLFAKNLGNARHIAVRDNGDVFVRLRAPKDGGTVVALRDGNRDGSAEKIERFGKEPGTGIAVHGGYLYYSTVRSIYRRRLGKGLLPVGEEEKVVAQFPRQATHAAKSFTLDDAGNLFVNVGAPSNSCQKRPRTAGSPGQAPCSQLESHAGVWRFDANRVGQHAGDGERYVTGTRNLVAIGWDPGTRALYAVQHGRDQLHDLFPDIYSPAMSAELPGEEFLRLDKGADAGWPTTYYDWIQGRRVLAPEYGGDGKKKPSEQFVEPLVAFPGHYAPNGLHFLRGVEWPEPYRGGAFVALHGSWNRAPQAQRGYHVAFVPMKNGQPTGRPFVFVDGFAGSDELRSPAEAKHRPMGLAQGPRSELYIADSVKGFVWQLRPTGAL